MYEGLNAYGVYRTEKKKRKDKKKKLKNKEKIIMGSLKYKEYRIMGHTYKNREKRKMT